LVFIGVYFLGPAIARPASRIIGWPLPRLRGQTGVLARENAMRNPRRTSSTAAALMIGVALVTLASVFFTSAKESAKQVVGRAFGGDFIVSTENQTGQTGVPLPLAAELRDNKEIGVVSEIQFLRSAKVNGDSLSVTAVNPADFVKVIDVDVQQGKLEDVKDPDIAVSQKYADAHDLAVGNTVDVEFPVGNSTRRVAAIYKDRTLVGSFVVTINSSQTHAGDEFDDMVFVNKASGASTDAARKVVEAASASYLTIKVQDETELKKEMTKQIDGVLNFFIVLLLLAVVIALIGIANTLALSVFERTRELGLLRAVGMTRRQMRSMVRWEAVIVALLGTMLGLVVGIAFGWALVTSAKSEGLEVLAIPWGKVAGILLIAAIAGIVSAILPARRAARIDVLHAIASE
jgi:putative ABC transport system permease protein